MSQIFMSVQQNKEYSKFLQQAKHLKETTFSNEFKKKCAWEELVVQFYQFAAEVRPKETFYLLLCFTASDYQLTTEQLIQVFDDLSMMLKAYVRKRSKHKEGVKLCSGPKPRRIHEPVSFQFPIDPEPSN